MTPPSPGSRTPPPSRYSRGLETRARIVAAATALFGEAGYEATTTRQIAASAGVNLPALKYYFDGKEGLYLTCAREIAADIDLGLSGVLSEMEAALAAAPADRDMLMAMIGRLVDQVADFWLGAEPQPGRVAFIVREQARPGAAFDILYGGVLQKLVGLCSDILARILRVGGDDPRARIRSLAILGQIIFFRVANATTLRVLGWPDLREERLDALKVELRRSVETSLRAELALQEPAA